MIIRPSPVAAQSESGVPVPITALMIMRQISCHKAAVPRCGLGSRQLTAADQLNGYVPIYRYVLYVLRYEFTAGATSGGTIEAGGSTPVMSGVQKSVLCHGCRYGAQRAPHLLSTANRIEVSPRLLRIPLLQQKQYVAA